MSERRRFARVLYLVEAELKQDTKVWHTQLIDISLQGALLNKPNDWQLSDNKDFLLSFCLGDSDIKISMQVELTHEVSQKLGFHCHHIDIDSATHLKRMIELNIGDEELLHRELNQLLLEHTEHS
ncbi:PilZ domain-containing protein [Aeromonas cavernicola]|uniref:Cyclic diguanosine monophosphate-binding protein n=1 Tax=Aeromonas cavernicola TaxID=1006623 RepID=A0A2H9U267_9GAMM|nr:PilZ domain-containing protein [Aeromonas cavernicola]PJG58125.1 PilZ domain-containing protein [Aeromonas cavernicola]